MACNKQRKGDRTMTKETKTEASEPKTKKENRLDWKQEGTTYSVTLHFAGGVTLDTSLNLILKDFMEWPQGLQELVKCGIREKISQVHNQTISSYRKKNKDAIENGTIGKLPDAITIENAVRQAIVDLECGRWPTDIKKAKERKYNLNEVQEIVYQGLVAQGISEERAEEIAASFKK